MKQFNVTCPAEKMCPLLERSYQSCKKTRKKLDCDPFIQSFEKLMPVYDCQRPFDVTHTAKYIVPAIWLCDDWQMENYLLLLSTLHDPKARRLFASPKFRKILDGHFAEKYLERSLEVERFLKTHNHK